MVSMVSLRMKVDMKQKDRSFNIDYITGFPTNDETSETTVS